MTSPKARRPAWLWALLLVSMWVCVVGCGGHWWLPFKEEPPPLIEPTDAELAQEMFSWHLPSAQPAPSPTPPEYFTHKVQVSGETFMSLARWYTGNADNWTRIAEANPDVDPRRMRLGAVIRIPEALVTVRRPMPKPQRPEVKPRDPAAEVELFGPIETPATPAKPGFNVTPPELEPLD